MKESLAVAAPRPPRGRCAAVAALALVVLAGCAGCGGTAGTQAPPEPAAPAGRDAAGPADEAASGFCGKSSMGACSSDAGCRKGGCSGQVCQARSEPAGFSTCEFRPCYDARSFGLGCKCVAGKCQWAK